MGADFLMAHCPWPDTLEWNDEVAAIVTERAKALPMLKDVITEWAYIGDDPTEEACVKRLVDAVRDVVEGQASREVTSLLVGEREHMFTGGMSWGDYPTDMMQPIILVAESQILEEPLFPVPDEEEADAN